MSNILNTRQFAGSLPAPALEDHVLAPRESAEMVSTEVSAVGRFGYMRKRCGGSDGRAANSGHDTIAAAICSRIRKNSGLAQLDIELPEFLRIRLPLG